MNGYFTSLPFVAWAVLFTIAFVGAVLALDAVGPGTTIVFVAGIVFGELADRAVCPFTDWYIESDDRFQIVSEGNR